MTLQQMNTPGTTEAAGKLPERREAEREDAARLCLTGLLDHKSKTGNSSRCRWAGPRDAPDAKLFQVWLLLGGGGIVFSIFVTLLWGLGKKKFPPHARQLLYQ